MVSADASFNMQAKGTNRPSFKGTNRGLERVLDRVLEILYWKNLGPVPAFRHPNKIDTARCCNFVSFGGQSFYM